MLNTSKYIRSNFQASTLIESADTFVEILENDFCEKASRNCRIDVAKLKLPFTGKTVLANAMPTFGM